MKSFSASILNKIRLPEEGRILLAFSGGEDSLFLLLALSFLAKERTEALYVNHNIREKGEIEREIALNRKNASLLGIPMSVVEIPPERIRSCAFAENTGIEAAARAERYRALKNYASLHGFDWIATAHHEDDQTETVLMRIMDSSPFWQWGGIREEDGMVVRPMLSVSKNEIMSAVKESGLEYSTDSTNSDTKYRRNYIRSFILPSVTEEEKKVISRIAANVRSLDISPIEFTHLSPFYVSFSRSVFLSSLPGVKEKTLLSVFSAFGEKERISRRYMREIEDAILRSSTRVENSKYIFYISGDEVKAYRKTGEFSSPYCGLDTALPSGLRIAGNLTSPLALRVSEETLSGSLLRTNRKGDTISLVDGKRKISSLLKERKVPYAVVLEKNGEICAVFTSFLGGRDRLSSSLRGKDGKSISIVIEENKK